VRLLLDTHALLWWLSDDERLGLPARDLIADPTNDVLVSVASLWEITVKVRVGKLQANIEEIGEACERDGFIKLAITPGHLKMLVGLPMHHRDPFDHLLIAQAMTEDATFLSDDRNMRLYAVQTVACSNLT
jgi:PIN domain nuclease of toxin-antitoxin system